MDVDCRFRLQLAPNQARSYPMRLNIQNALLDPNDAANQAPDGVVRAQACFAAEDLGWFGWLFGQEIDRDCHSFVVPEAAVAHLEVPGDEGEEGADEEGAPEEGADEEEAPELTAKLEHHKNGQESRAAGARRSASSTSWLRMERRPPPATVFVSSKSFPEGLRNNVIASSDGAISCEQQSDLGFICSGASDLIRRTGPGIQA